VVSVSSWAKATLANIEGVKQAVVIDKTHPEGESSKYLAAYMVAESEAAKATLTDDFFIEQLKAQLPEYMVPSSFMLIDDIPTTLNGKLDRRALPEPTFDNADDYVAPTHHRIRNPAMRNLATGAWGGKGGCPR